MTVFVEMDEATIVRFRRDLVEGLRGDGIDVSTVTVERWLFDQATRRHSPAPPPPIKRYAGS